MQPLLLRQAECYAAIRVFFAARDVLEVQTPLLAETTVCDPNLQSLTTSTGQKKLFLQTSPEFAMKQLLASGSSSIYQICKAFRDDPVGRHHRPEFTMLEWYRLGFGYHDLMQEVEQLITELLGITAFNRLSYTDAFQQTTGLNPLTASISQLENVAGDVAGDLGRDDLLDLIMGTRVIPAISEQNSSAIFIYDYPKSQAAQARVSGEYAERFELIIDGVELANGYTELTDPVEQRRRFIEENRLREKNRQEPVPLDETFLRALEDLPPCAGVAVGLDRLLMLACGKKSLSETMLFPA